jgi:hypothetical protein
MPTFYPTTAESARNNNAAFGGSTGAASDVRVFDIKNAVSGDASKWKVGGDAVNAVLRFYMASATDGVDWSDPQSVMAICADVAGSIIPTDLEMHAGADNTGAKCTPAFQYTVGAENPLTLTTGASTTFAEVK